MVKYQVINFQGIYEADLGFNQVTLDKIIEQIYELENDKDKKYHSAGRTFQIKNGFHSCNILDSKLGLMEKYTELNLLVSRIQEILFTEFANGKLNYKVNADSYSDIKAFAINDGIGLVIEGSIDRKNKLLNLEGQISPLYLISGIIQKIPIFGQILIGNEGDGILAVEYSMSGNQDDPVVKSNPLSIFKPRLFERTIEFLQGGT